MSLSKIKAICLNSPLVSRFIKGGLWLVGGGTLASILNAISTFAVAGYLGVKDYGSIALISSTVLLVSGVLTLRTTESVTKYLLENILSKEIAKANDIVALGIKVDFVVASFSSIVLLIFASIIVEYFFESNEYLLYFQIYALTPIFTFCYASSIAINRVAEKFSYISIVEVLKSILLILGNVYLIFIQAPWNYFLMWMVVVSMLRGSILFFYLYKSIKLLGLSLNIFSKLSLTRGELKSVFQLMLTSSAAFVVKTAHTQADTVLIGALLGPSSSGAYKLARNIIQILAMPTNAIFQLSFPEFVKILKEKQVEKFSKLINNLILATIGLCFVYIIGIWLLAPIVIPYVLGESYSDTIQLLPYLVVGLSVVMVSQYWHATLVAINRAGQVANSNLIALVLQLATLLLLLEELGIFAAVAAYLVYCSFRAVFLYSRYKKFV